MIRKDDDNRVPAVSSSQSDIVGDDRDHEKTSINRKLPSAVTRFVRSTLSHSCYIFLLALLMLFVQLNDRFLMPLRMNLIRLDRFHHSHLLYYNPWQYRALSFWLLDAWYWLLRFLHIEFTDTQLVYTADGEVFLTVLANEWPLLIFKLLQNMLLLSIVFKLYRLFTSQNLLAYMGLMFLAYILGLGNFNSDLSFNVYFDVIFYSCACFWILQKKYHYFPLLIIVAALNRETSALIPLLLLAEGINFAQRKVTDWRAVVLAGLSFFLYVLIFFSLRFYYGYVPARGVYHLANIREYWHYNLTLPASFMKLLMVFSLLPVFAITTWNRWPRVSKTWFWLVFPIWCIVHLSMSVVAESRLFYVPVTVIFMPAFLASIDRSFKIDSPHK
jgi:hypothetical protein